MNNSPSSFCTICTDSCKKLLTVLLQTIQIHHKNIPIFIYCDEITKNYVNNNSYLFPDLKINCYVELNKWTYYNRDKMTAEKCFGTFLENKMNVMIKTLETNNDTLFLDTDVIFLSPIKDIDHSKMMGLSPQYVNDVCIKRTGKYNAGFFWTKSKDVCLHWISIINHNRKCPEQINMHLLCDKFDYFEFGDNYNIQPSRFTAGIHSSLKKMRSFITINETNKICYNNKEIVCLHTHFGALCLKEINNFLFYHLVKCKTYEKEISIINTYLDSITFNMDDIKTYWINLDRNPERKLKMENQLREYNIINHQRIEGIDGKKLDFSDYKKNCENITVYELACTLSHLKAIQCAHNNGDTYALIIEDDCSFEYVHYQHFSIKQFIEKMDNEYKNWHVLQLCTSGRIDQNERMRDNPNIIERKNKNCTTAYLISKKGMEHLLESTNRYSPADNYLYSDANNTYYLTKPYFTYYYSNVFSSSVHNQGENSNQTNYKREDKSKRFWDDYYVKK